MPTFLADADNVQPPLLSKNQQKKELRRARSAQLHASRKALKKAQTLQLKAAKMEEVRATIQAMSPEERAAWESVRGERRQERRELATAKKERLRRALEGNEGEEGGGSSSLLKVIVDCGFPEGMMTASEARSLAGQLARCVGSNARAALPARLAFAGISFPCSTSASSAASSSSISTAQLLSERLDNIDGRERWPVRWLASLEEEAAAIAAAAADAANDDAAADAGASADDAARSPSPNKKTNKGNKSKLIYLSADSKQELSESLDPAATFVIGGLVDRNRHRGAALSRALSLGIDTARLPLQSLGGAVLNSSSVLTVDQTFALLLAAVNAGSSRSGDGGEREEEEGEREEEEGEREEEEGEEETETETKATKAKKKALRADWAAGVRAAVPTRKLARPQEQEQQQQQQQEVSGA